MDPFDFLYEQNEWLIFAVLLALLMLLVEIAYRVGRRRFATHSETKSMVAGIQGEIAAILGLLLGFSFAMAVSRFDSRKAVAIDESNAIETAYLRTQLLKEPQRSAIANLLKQYIALRLQSTDSNLRPAVLDAIEAETGKRQAELWTQAITAAEQDPRFTTNLVIQALNEVFDLRSKRNGALANRVPGSVIFLLFMSAALAVAGLGYHCGLQGRRVPQATIALCFLVGLVTLVIIDLDRPRRGFIRVSQQSMQDVRARMK